MKSTMKKITCFVVALMFIVGGVFTVSAKETKVAKAASVVSYERRYYDEPVVSARSVEIVETVTFATKDDTYIGTPNNVPYYYNTNFDNGCGAVGGAIVVGYYDKYFENLIPDYTNYYPATGKYRPQDNTYVPALIQNLYTAMQTNVVAPGVSESECLDGLRSYVQSKGYSINYTAVKPYAGSFSHTAYQNAINNGQPVIMFCDSIIMRSARTGDTVDEFVLSQQSQDHIIVGFGYRVIKYYDENNTNFRTDIYVKVASGWYPNHMGYIKINEDSWLDSCFAVDIY